MAFDYIPGNTILHRMDVRLKLFIYVTVMFLCVVWTDPIFQASLFVGITILIHLGHIPRTTMTAFMLTLIPVGIICSTLVLLTIKIPNSHPIWVLFKPFGPFNGVISIEGIVWSLGSFLRFINILLIVRVILIVTPIKDVITGMVKLGLPPEFGMAASIGLGYLPVMVNEVSQIKESLMGRGWKYKYRNPIRRGKEILIRIFLPSVKRSITRTNQIALAIESRGFSYNVAGRTYLKEPKFQGRDYVILILILTLITWGAISTWIYGWSKYQNFSVPIVLDVLGIE